MHRNKKLSAAGLAMVAGLAAAPRAQAQTDATMSWANAAGGSAATASNWSPVAVPLATDDLTFNLATNYGVTFNGTVPTSRTHSYRAGALVLTMASPHTTTNGVAIADLTGDTATVTLGSGSWTSGPSGFVNIGDATGTNGTLNIAGSDAVFSVTGASDLFVGNNGIGTMNVTGRGTATIADTMHVGQGSAATGNLTVSGALSVSPFGRSSLNVNGLGESRWGNGGDATVSVANGALAHFGGTLSLGNLSTSISSVTVGGTGFIFNATLDVDSDLFIARNSSAGVLPGTGTLTVNNGGDVTVGGAVRIGGDPDGAGAGILRINGGGFVTAHDIVAGAGGDIQHVGGVMQIDGGSLTNDSPVITVSNTVANDPVLALVNAGNATATATANPGRALIIGGTAGTSTGTLDIRSGGDMFVVANPIGGIVDASIGVSSDDTGDVLVDGAGSTFRSSNNNSTLFIGEGGNATASVTAGGLLSFGTVNVSGDATSTSTVSIDGAGSKVEARVQLNVGGDATGLGGVATMTAGNGGRIDAPTASATAVRIWQDGEVILNSGGQLTTTGTVDIRSGGLLTLSGGSASAGVVLVENGGDIAGSGTVTGDINVQSGGGIAANGTLILGDATSNAGFVMSASATLGVGAFSVTTNDNNQSTLGTVTIGGGSLTALHGILLPSAASISGTGVVSGSVSMIAGSTMTATGATGLRFNQIVLSNTGGLSGTIFGFNNGSGYNGEGTIAAKVDFDAGSALFNGGTTTMGDGTATGVTFAGTMHVGSGTVTLLDSNGVGLDGLTDIDGGTLICAQQLVVNSLGPIQGRGSVQAPLLLINNGGRIKPGDLTSVDDSINLLRVVGTGNALTMAAGSFYDCDLGLDFKNIRASDRITSAGILTLNGTLTVHLVTGFTPAASDIYDIAIGSTRSGVFSSTVFPPVGAFGPMHVEYLPDRARLVMCYANCDGSVVAPSLNVQDFACFLNRFAAGDAYANCDSSTIPPVLNVQDFACFLNKFAAGCP